MSGFIRYEGGKCASRPWEGLKPCSTAWVFCLLLFLAASADAQTRTGVRDGFFGAAHDPVSIVSRKPSDLGKSVQEKSSTGIGSDSFVVPRRARPKKAAVEASRRQATGDAGTLKSAPGTNSPTKTSAQASTQISTQAQKNSAATTEVQSPEPSGSVRAIQEERRNNPYSRQMNEVRRAIRGESEDKAINSVVNDAKELSRRMNALKAKAGAGRADPEYIRRATELVNEVVKSQPLKKRRRAYESPGSNRF